MLIGITTLSLTEVAGCVRGYNVRRDFECSTVDGVIFAIILRFLQWNPKG